MYLLPRSPLTSLVELSNVFFFFFIFRLCTHIGGQPDSISSSTHLKVFFYLHEGGSAAEVNRRHVNGQNGLRRVPWYSGNETINGVDVLCL